MTIANHKYISSGAMVCSAWCWGSATVMSKASLDSFSPSSLLVIQLFSSVSFLWTAALISGLGRSINRELIWRGSIGIFEPGLAYLFVLIGLCKTSACTASLIATTEPLMVLFLSALFFGEKIGRKLYALSLFGIFGVYLTLGPGGAEFSIQSINGVLMVLAGTFCAAIYMTLSPFSLRNGHPLVVAAIQQSWGLLMILTLGAFGQVELFSGMTNLDSNVWVLAIFSGIIQYALSFWCYLYAIKELPIVQATMLLNLIPVFAIVTGYVALNERLMLIQWIGAGFILLAVGGSSILMKPRCHPA